MDRSSLTKLGAWVILVLSAVFFLTTGGTYPGIASVQAHVIGQIIAIAVLGGWLVISLVRPAWRVQTPLLVPVALVAGALLAAGIASQRQRLSFEPMVAGLGWALALLFMSRLLARPWFRARVAVVMTAFVTVVSVGYLIQVAIEWINWWGLVGRLAVPPLRPSFAALFLGSPNLIGTALELLAPLVVALAWTRSRRPWFAVFLAVASGLAILVSGSRGAWLGVGVGTILALVLATTRPGARISPRAILGALRARPIFLLPVGLAGVVGLVLAPSLLARFAQGGGSLRLDLWKSALTIFAEHPILGAGPGTWVQLKVAANPPGVPNLILPHAHNFYVQAAAELGVVGLLAIAVLALAVVRRLGTAWRADADDDRSRGLSLEAGAVLVSLAAFAAQSIVDNLTNLPFVALILVSLVAWIDGRLVEGEPGMLLNPGVCQRSNGVRFRSGVAVAVAALAGFVAVTPTLIRVDRAALVSLAGTEAAQRGHWQRALESYEQAMALDPGFTLYELEAAGALARVGRVADARDLLEHAVESDAVAINLIGLAALDAQVGDREAALAHIGIAIELGVGEPAIALNAGLIAEQLGDRALALDQFAYAVAIDPPLISSGIWNSPPRIATKPEIVEEARKMVDQLDGALLVAYAGQPAAARAELDTATPSSRRDVYIAATEWLGGDPVSALARIDRLLESDPGDWFAAAWGARIARLTRNPDAQNRYSKWALVVQGDAAPGVIGDLSAVPASFDAPTASLPGNYPWSVYLRPIVPFLFGDALVTIGER